MIREAAIESYRKQPDSEFLKTSDLYQLTEIVAELEDVLLELEIHIEHINNLTYAGYDSYKKLTNVEFRRKFDKVDHLLRWIDTKYKGTL